MHDHDLDLIADHLGTPSDQARRLIGSCTECAAEHRLQTEIHDRLAGLGDASMTADECARLHSRIETALDAKVVLFSTAGWFKLASVAAALLVVVGVGRFLARDLVESGPTATTIAASERLSADQEAAAPADALTAGDFQAVTPRTRFGVLVGEVTLQDVADLLAQSEEDFARSSSAAVRAPGDASPPACLQLLEAPVSRVVEATVEGRPLVAYLTADTEPPITIAYYADTCEAVDLPE